MESTVIRACKVADILDAPGFNALLVEYGAESAVFGVPAAPQRDRYDALEAAGFLHVIGAFQGETLVGFIALLVSRVAHFAEPMGVTESFFVRRDAPSVGLTLRCEAERVARELGAYGLLISVPVGSRAEAFMAASRGYRTTNRVFFKALQS